MSNEQQTYTRDEVIAAMKAAFHEGETLGAGGWSEYDLYDHPETAMETLLDDLDNLEDPSENDTNLRS